MACSCKRVVVVRLQGLIFDALVIKLCTGSGVSTVEHKRMEEVAKRAAQRALNQLRMSRRTLRAGAGQVDRDCIFVLN